MKQIQLIFLLIVFSYFGNAQSINVKGNVSGKWEKVNSPIKVTGDILIPEGEMLTIDEGVTVEFQGEYEFKVDGVIQVNGTKTDSVRFTSPDGINWKGFYFILSLNYTNNLPSNLRYTIIENANKDEGGGIYVLGPKNLTIENSVIQKCNSSMGGGIKIWGDIQEMVLVKNCIFRKNHAGIFGGGAVYLDLVNSKFIGCLIYDNTSDETSAAVHTIGHGYSPKFINCTICDNITNNDFFKSVTIGNDAIFENTIIYHNKPAGINVASDFYKPEFRFCNFEQPLKITMDQKFLNFNGVIDNCLIGVKPEFIDRENRDYRLKISHNINNGNPGFDQIGYVTDMNGNPRIYEEEKSRIDIGAFEYQGELSNRTPTISNEKEFYLPDITTSKINLNFYDADSLDQHQIHATVKNQLVAIEASQPEKFVFTLDIHPNGIKKESVWINVKIVDNSGAANAELNDSILVHFSNQFKGEITNYIEFKDTVKVTGDILVTKGGKLKVLPGAIIQFQGDYEINVFGDTDINGTKDKKVVMNGIDTAYYEYTSEPTTYKLKKGWGGIILHSVNNLNFSYMEMNNTINGCFKLYDSDNIKFNNCEFYHCYANEVGNAGVFAVNSETEIDSCIFKYGTTGMDVTGEYVCSTNSKVSIGNSLFSDNISYADRYPDYCSISSIESELEIKKCTFENINTNYTIFITTNTNSIIEESIFKNNKAIYITEVFSDYCLIRNNAFIKNNGLCIRSRISEIDVVNNLVAYNEHRCNCSNTYAFIDLQDSGVGDSARVVNNTVYGNSTDALNGGGVYFSYVMGTAYNNILWNNLPEEIGWYNGIGVDPDLKDPKIFNNVIKGGYNQAGNFDSDPGFTFKDSLDFTLNSGSFCIDKGIYSTSELFPEIDIANNLRINPRTNKLDIGAYEFYETTGMKNIVIDDEIQVFPNPANNFVNIRSSKNKTIHVIRIYAIDGKLLKKECPDKIYVNMDINDLNQGTYIIQVVTDGLIRNLKFIKH
jgi:hypothetical protein